MASPPISSRRLWVLTGLLLVALLAVGWHVAHSAEGLPRLAMYDFVEDRAAGHLAIRGENPYDPDRIHELERQLGRETEAVLMWNPPWTLPLVMPLCAAGPPGATFRLLVQFGVLVLCSEWLCYHGGDPQRRGVAWLVTFTFLPTLCSRLDRSAGLPARRDGFPVPATATARLRRRRRRGAARHQTPSRVAVLAGPPAVVLAGTAPAGRRRRRDGGAPRYSDCALACSPTS